MATDAPFDVQAAKNALIDLVKSIPGLRQVNDGPNESATVRTMAWVVVGDLVAVTVERLGGVYSAEWNLIVTFAYVVKGAESAAEDAVAAYLTEFTRRVIHNRTLTVTGTFNGSPVSVAPMLNGSVSTLGVPHPAAMPSDYLVMAGQEVRAYPLAVGFIQRETVPASN